MKKLLSILAAVTLTASTASIVVACGTTENKGNKPDKPEKPNENKVDKTELKQKIDEANDIVKKHPSADKKDKKELIETLEKSKNIFEQKNSTEIEVTQAKNDLEKAIKSFNNILKEYRQSLAKEISIAKEFLSEHTNLNDDKKQELNIAIESANNFLNEEDINQEMVSKEIDKLQKLIKEFEEWLKNEMLNISKEKLNKEIKLAEKTRKDAIGKVENQIIENFQKIIDESNNIVKNSSSLEEIEDQILKITHENLKIEELINQYQSPEYIKLKTYIDSKEIIEKEDEIKNYPDTFIPKTKNNFVDKLNYSKNLNNKQEKDIYIKAFNDLKNALNDLKTYYEEIKIYLDNVMSKYDDPSIYTENSWHQFHDPIEKVEDEISKLNLNHEFNSDAFESTKYVINFLVSEPQLVTNAKDLTSRIENLENKYKNSKIFIEETWKEFKYTIDNVKTEIANDQGECKPVHVKDYKKYMDRIKNAEDKLVTYKELLSDKVNEIKIKLINPEIYTIDSLQPLNDKINEAEKIINSNKNELYNQDLENKIGNLFNQLITNLESLKKYISNDVISQTIADKENYETTEYAIFEKSYTNAKDAVDKNQDLLNQDLEKKLSDALNNLKSKKSLKDVILVTDLGSIFDNKIEGTLEEKNSYIIKQVYAKNSEAYVNERDALKDLSFEWKSGNEGILTSMKYKDSLKISFTIKLSAQSFKWIDSNGESKEEKFTNKNAFKDLDVKEITSLGWYVNEQGEYETPILPTSLEKISTQHLPTELQNLSHMFEGNQKMNDPSVTFWDTSNVTNMSHMFDGAKKFDQNFDSELSKWDTSNVTDMSYMFANTEKFNNYIEQWDTSNVTNMSHMFDGAKVYNKKLIGWSKKLSKVTDMSYMFANAGFNNSISGWDLGNLTTTSHMFDGTVNFNQRIDRWINTKKLIDMSYMFANSQDYNRDFYDLDTSNVTNMSYMFANAKNFNGNLNDLNTSNVTDMSHMFDSANNFYLMDMNKFDVSKVEDMSYMFANTDRFKSKISDWNTSNVKNMSHMFYGSKKFDQDISKWDTSKVTDMSYMFASSEYYDTNIEWKNTSNVKNMSHMFDSAERFNSELNIDVSTVEDMSYMFANSEKFNNKSIQSWKTSSVINMESMFAYSQFSKNISDWDVSNVKKHKDFDKGTSWSWIAWSKPTFPN